jgi:hypothetical protein
MKHITFDSIAFASEAAYHWGRETLSSNHLSSLSWAGTREA